MKKKIIVSLVIVLLIASLLGVYFIFSEKPTDGLKDVTIKVTLSTGETSDYSVKTDAEFLKGAMEQADGLSFSGEEGPYGIMVLTVNGETVNYSINQSYWAFYVNGEYCMYGIDSQPINDGDVFEIVYTIG